MKRLRVPAFGLILLALATACSAPARATPSPAAQPTLNATNASAEVNPPAGLLTFLGETVEGWQGSYCWDDVCVDSGGIPPRDTLPHLDAPGDRLEFALATGAPFVSWAVSYGEDGESLQDLEQGGSDVDPDTGATPAPELTSAEFSTPPVGDWVLVVNVTFANGDASYAWRVTVI